ELLSNTLDASQQHFRLAALNVAAKRNPAEAPKLLSAEINRFDQQYRRQVLIIAGDHSGNASAIKLWDKAIKKADEQTKSEVLSMLSRANKGDDFVTERLLPALSS